MVVHEERRQVCSQVERKRDPAPCELFPVERHQLFEDAIHLLGSKDRAGGPGKTQVLFDQPVESRPIGLDGRDQRHARLGPHLVLEQLQIQADGPERVVDLVGDLGGHPPDGGQAFGLDRLRLGMLEVLVRLVALLVQLLAGGAIPAIPLGEEPQGDAKEAEAGDPGRKMPEVDRLGIAREGGRCVQTPRDNSRAKADGKAEEIGAHGDDQIEEEVKMAVETPGEPDQEEDEEQVAGEHRQQDAPQPPGQWMAAP